VVLVSRTETFKREKTHEAWVLGRARKGRRNKPHGTTGKPFEGTRYSHEENLIVQWGGATPRDVKRTVRGKSFGRLKSGGSTS